MIGYEQGVNFEFWVIFKSVLGYLLRQEKDAGPYGAGGKKDVFFLLLEMMLK